MSVTIIEELNATSTGTIVIPDNDWSLHMITAVYDSGTNVVVKVGTTVGGNDVVYGLTPSVTDPIKVATVHGDYYGGDTLYYTVTGTSQQVDIFAQCIKNRQTVTEYS